MNVKQGIIVNIKTMNYMPAKKVSIYRLSKHSIGRFAPPVQAGKDAARSANQIEAPCPAGTISAPPPGGLFPVRAPKILFSGLSPWI